jgi:hypothetical protein
VVWWCLFEDDKCLFSDVILTFSVLVVVIERGSAVVPPEPESLHWNILDDGGRCDDENFMTYPSR